MNRDRSRDLLERRHDSARITRPDLHGRDRPHDVGLGLCRESQCEASNDALPHEAVDPVLDRASGYAKNAGQGGGGKAGFASQEFDQTLVGFVEPHALCRFVNITPIMRNTFANSIVSLASC